MQNPKSVLRVTEDAHGLSSVCSCFMSSYPKSRILALQLLVHVLELSASSHALILEALTTIRVVFGEPVRFKFLVGLLQGSIDSPPVFQTAALKFLNILLKKSPRPADRIRLQCELEEAGLDIGALETELRSRCIPCTDSVWSEIETWRTTYLDMESVAGGKQNLETENERLQKEVEILRQALQKLEEDKINLMQIEMELKEKCEDLNEEVTSLKTGIKKATSVAEIHPTDITSNFLNDDDDDLLLSGDSRQLGTEEIFIDVPTIRPPKGFRSDNSCYSDPKNSPNLSSKSSSFSNSPPSLKNSFQTSKTNFSSKRDFESKIYSSDKESADSALSESESDSGINWSYPDISDSRTGHQKSHIYKFKEDNKSISTRLHPKINSKHIVAPRSRSEDRRETSKTQNFIECKTKVVESNFFMLHPTRTDLGARIPTNEINGKISKYSEERSAAIIPSYQLPVAYRSNFLKRGHSNCDLYSGVNSGRLEKVPPIPSPDYNEGISVAASGGTISALVHREITKAVKQISGWI
ncbi:uncharacterized protein LOC118203114 [Stegodyphus dumicola]|uniref:uncharacterized protein LOC118203114 n=1 Tax=Stegodyphus dumicola TaxID=202533 RepID=UPI0015B372D6|nr:uncharacterized protein LOC118203114 [Stegodyphus dumicola]